VTSALATQVLPALLHDLDTLDRDAAVDRVKSLRAPLADVVSQLLVPAQVEVGRRWEAGERSVAWEHAATAITDVALLTAAALAPVPPPRGRVLVACAEREWHSMPARMLGELLRERGWDAVLVGANAPADALVDTIREQEAFALLVSCTMTVHLPGAWRAVQAGHRAGVPVLVGGAAFADAARAGRLGADASSGSTEQTTALLERWCQERPAPADDVVVEPEHLRLLAVAPDLVHAGAAESRAADRDRVREDVSDVVALLAAAVLVHDGSVLRDGLQWRARYRASRGSELERGAIRGLTAHLQDLGLPHAARLLRDYGPDHV
jgi:methanogenic corrinoid protein MtbC1